MKNAGKDKINNWLKVSILAVGLLIAIGLFPSTKENNFRRIENEQAYVNLRALGELLNEFHDHYGHYPSPQIPIDLQDRYPQKERQDSNYILGQLAVFKNMDTEQLRELTSIGRPARKPSTSEILAPGDCQFAYVSNALKKVPNAPLLIGPVIPGTILMDEKRIGTSKASYITVDGRTPQNRILSGGGISFKNGKTILDHGPETIWGEIIPQVHPTLEYQQSQVQAPPLFYRFKPKQILMIGALGIVTLYWIILTLFEKRATRS